MLIAADREQLSASGQKKGMLGAASDVTDEDVEAEALRHVDLAASIMPGRLRTVTKLAVEVAALREVLSVSISNLGCAMTIVLAGVTFICTRSGRLDVVSLILAPRVVFLKLLRATRMRFSLFVDEATALLVVLER